MGFPVLSDGVNTTEKHGTRLTGAHWTSIGGITRENWFAMLSEAGMELGGSEIVWADVFCAGALTMPESKSTFTIIPNLRVRFNTTPILSNRGLLPGKAKRRSADQDVVRFMKFLRGCYRLASNTKDELGDPGRTARVRVTRDEVTSVS